MKDPRIIQLPQGYISYSQLSLWNNDPERYAELYFDRQDFLRSSNAAMEYGKAVADSLENEQDTGDLLTDSATLMLKKYDVRDKEIWTHLDTKEGRIPIIGKPDTMDSTSFDFREYKTGKNPWTKRRAQDHLQMKFYAMVIYLAHKKLLRDAWLDWIETETTPEGVVVPTGYIESFRVTFSLTDILETMALTAKSAKEIEAAWAAHVPDKKWDW